MFRNAKRMGRWTAIAVAIGLFCSSQALAKKPPTPPDEGDKTAPYALVDLLGLPGGPGGGFQSSAVAVSEPDEGGGVWVAGNSHTQGDPTPAFWSVSGDGSFTITGPGLPPGATEAGASDVNDVGVITINTWQTDQAEDPAWVLVPGMPLQQLPMFDALSAGASAVNNLGEIVGSTGGLGALWTLDAQGAPGNPISLGDFYPADVNDLGMMAGKRNGQPAIAWFDGGALQVLELGMLQGFDAGTANAISEDGTWVTGDVRPFAGPQETFIWSEADGMIGLGSLAGRNNWANDVNNAGQVVGTADTKYGGRYSMTAVLWENGQVFDLNTLTDAGSKIHLQIAKGINNAGHIAGLMGISRPVSESHGYVLIPTEP